MGELKNTDAIQETLKIHTEVIRRTHNMLAQIIPHPGRRPTVEQLHCFLETLEYTGQVHEGFMLSQRASPQIGFEELLRLNQPVLFDWQWVKTMNLLIRSDDEVKVINNQLIAFQQAMMALGALPNLPTEIITFPQPYPSYTDIPVPTRPGQILERIEEIEYVIYRAALVPLDHIPFGAVRRAYAFFEAGVWLVDQFPPSLRVN